jgi:hypothetical protein
MQPDFDYELNRRKKDMAAAIVIHQCKRISLILRGFNPNQPRDDHGRWTDGGGSSYTPANSSNRLVAVAPIQSEGTGVGGWPMSNNLQPQAVQLTGDDFNQKPQFIQSVDNNTQYSPDKSGWHKYTTEPNIVCEAWQKCTRDEMKDYLSRFAYPSQNPDVPVKHESTNLVFDPLGKIGKVGYVTTEILDDGLTIQNETIKGHLFHAGKITRTAKQAEDGSWSITTQGIGNNVTSGMNYMNEQFGPAIFNLLDAEMRLYISKRYV